MAITKRLFGTLPSGELVDLYTIANASGARVSIATYGGCIVSIEVPDRHGVLSDVTLGYDQLAAMREASGYMGMLIGRFANRIAKAQFTLEGKAYTLAANNGENHLHGGNHGFDAKVWQAKADENRLVLTCESPNGEEGYPGKLDIEVIYTWSDDNALSIHYRAVTDQTTILNLTNHTYFNLSGPACTAVLDHRIRIDADTITAVCDRACIPTGELRPVANTPFDLRAFHAIGEGIDADDEQIRFGNGYDHNFVLNHAGEGMRLAVEVQDDASGRQMTVYTDQPGVQFYTGNAISGQVPGKLSVPYQRRQGFCLETQVFPDSINHANFPSCVLRPGEVFETTTIYQFSTL